MTMRRILSATALVTGVSLPATVMAAQSDPAAKHERALSMQASGSQLMAVARLHVESARGRAPADPQAQRCLSTAAHLHYYAGSRTQARRLLIEASEVALRRGDVEYAAHSLLTAAVIAQETKNASALEELVQRAELLAQGPALSIAQRAAILARIQRRGEIVAVTR